MNVNDVEELQEIPENMVEFIFKTQRTLMEKYEIIEAENGLLHTADIPVDLHDKMGQAKLKDMAWRCIEEVTEAIEAFYKTHEEDYLLHAQEEVADALHFFVEFTILAGISHEEVSILQSIDFVSLQKNYRQMGLSPFETSIVNFTMYLGLACNQLKNKPWKQTHMLTDVSRFKQLVIVAWDAFIFMAGCFGIENFEQLFQLYFRKSEVNKFRQRSKY